jgi:hypothetical protein
MAFCRHAASLQDRRAISGSRGMGTASVRLMSDDAALYRL